MTLRVIFVSERTTMAWTSPMRGMSSASGKRFSSTLTLSSGHFCKSATPFGETGSHTKTFIIQSGEDHVVRVGKAQMECSRWEMEKQDLLKNLFGKARAPSFPV